MKRPPWTLAIVFDSFLVSGAVAEESAQLAAERASKQYGFRHVRIEGGKSYPMLVISFIDEENLHEMNRFLTDAYEDYLLHRVEIVRNRIHIEKTLSARREEEQAIRDEKLKRSA